MPLRREGFTVLSLPVLLMNISQYFEYVRRGNCAEFFNDYIDYNIEFAERLWSDRYKNFCFVIKSLLHGKEFGFSNISTSNIDIIYDLIKK